MSASVISRPHGLRRQYLNDKDKLQRNAHSSDTIPSSLDARIRSAAIVGPDIEWDPSYQTYLERVERLSKLSHDRPKSVPEGYPRRINAPWVWSGGETREEEYVIIFEDSDIVEIEAALRQFKRKHRNDFACAGSVD